MTSRSRNQNNSSPTGRIVLNAADIAQAKRFAETIVVGENLTQYQFLNDSITRPQNLRILDCAIGKLAEVAFAKFISQYGIMFKPDFTIYDGKRNTDGGSDIDEFQYTGIRYKSTVKVDVKCNRGPCHWLIEKPEIAKKADVLVLVQAQVDQNNRDDIAILNNSWIEFDVHGYIPRKYMFYQVVNEWMPKFYFRNGDPLYEPVRVFNDNLKLMKTREDVETAKIAAQETGHWKKFAANIKAKDACGYPRYGFLNSESDWQKFAEWFISKGRPVGEENE